MIFLTQSGHAYVAAPETPQNDTGRNVLHKTSNLAMARLWHGVVLQTHGQK